MACATNPFLLHVRIPSIDYSILEDVPIVVLRPIPMAGLFLLCGASVLAGQLPDASPEISPSETSPAPAMWPYSIGKQLDRLHTLDEHDANRLKQQLLVELFDRIETATKITLRGSTLSQRLRQQEQALRTPDHRQFTVRQIRALWQEVERLEKTVVLSLARRYRIEIYNSFRTQRSAYDRRLYAWNRVERTWQKAGQPIDVRPELIRWLDEAITASRVGKIVALPATPEFLASRSPRLLDVPQHDLPLASLPSRAVPPTPEVDRSADDRPLATIVHPSPPLLTQLPPAQIPDAPVDADISPSESRRTPAQLPETLTIDFLPPPVAPPVAANSVDGLTNGPSNPARINLVEFDARVAGYDLALATLRDQLEQPGPWTIDRLAPLVELIDELATRRSDLQLYRRLVPSVQQQQLAAMTPPAATAALLARRIVQAKDSLAQPSDALRLDELSQQVTKLLRQ